MSLRLCASLFVLAALAGAQEIPAGWKIVKDRKGACQIAVPGQWTIRDASGTAVFRDPDTALVVVNSIAGRAFTTLSENVRKQIGTDKVYENTGMRVFYADQIAKTPGALTGLNVRVPLEGGICSMRIMFQQVVADDVARKIALSLTPVP